MTAPAHPLVDLARSSLERLAAVPRFGAPCKGSAESIEKAWVRAPLTVAIGGALPARTELFNQLCGKPVFDAKTRPLGSAALRIRRGKHTRFKATRDDGSTEEHVLPLEQADDDALRLRAQSAKAALDERELALVRVDKGLPRFARARPHGLWILLWPLWWLLTRRHRRALADRRFTEQAYDQARDALKHAETELATSEARIRVERGRFFESLRALASGPPLGTHVREVTLELADGPLPPGVELLEMTRPKVSEQVDATLLVERDAFHAPHGEGGTAPSLGPTAEVIPNLLALLGKARALVLASRAHGEIAPQLALLDDEVNDTEEAFRVRIERLEAMQIMDAQEFAVAELTKVKPQVSQSIHAVIEHAASHLGGELERLGLEWAHAIATAQDTEQLKSAVVRIEQSAPLDAKRIADEVRSLVVGGAAGSAHDIFPELVASLRAHGLEEPRPREAPALPPIEVLPSLSNPSPSKLTGAGAWLSGLFKSFDSRRQDVIGKAQARIAHLREVAAAEILDIEPRMRTVIEQTLHQSLLAAIGRQVAWLDRTLTTERAAVAAEGLALAPLSRARDQLKVDLARLTEGIEALVQSTPGLYDAAGLAATSDDE